MVSSPSKNLGTHHDEEKRPPGQGVKRTGPVMSTGLPRFVVSVIHGPPRGKTVPASLVSWKLENGPSGYDKEGTMDKEAWVGDAGGSGNRGGGSTEDPLHAVLSLSKLSIQRYAV